MSHVVYPFPPSRRPKPRSSPKRRQPSTRAVRLALRLLRHQTLRLHASRPDLVASILHGFARLLSEGERVATHDAARAATSEPDREADG